MNSPPPPVASDGEIRLCATRCDTCIYRPGNLMRLSPGRVAQMTRDALANEGHIVCHSTLDEPLAAICRGFADHPRAQRSLALRIGTALGMLRLVDPPAHPPAPDCDERNAT